MKEKYTFIGNQPLGKDLFKNQSQEKIATVITQHIISDEKFKIIGIDGTWGSGKSNLVQIVEKKLGDKYKFFIYDVWGHQEDEQRKAILVELTDFIKKKDNDLVKNRNDWEDKLGKLLANRKETKTVNQPYLSVGFIFTILSIVYVPMVNAFKEDNFFGLEKIWSKIMLVTAPILVVIGIFLYNLVRNWRKKTGLFNSFRVSAEETFQVYTNKQKEETKVETISENQPTVRNFQDWMSEIDTDLKKKVVIVFDNFDRLPKKNILNIWSSIHIFFAEKRYNMIKVIIPFDREHLLNAFKDLNNDKDKSFADDYINKTFDIVFRISLPILSDWKRFFRDNWELAFLDHDTEELERVIQVYECLQKRITPRGIISFINETLTTKFINDKYLERYIAIFILCKDNIVKDPLGSVINFTYLNGLSSVYRDDKSFAEQITGIVYHIAPENALELIYTEELRKSLITRDEKKFNEICRADFINDIFFNVINELMSVNNAVYVVNSLESNTRLAEHLQRDAWYILYQKAIDIFSAEGELSPEEWELILISKIEDSRYIRLIFGRYYGLAETLDVEEFSVVVDMLSDRVGKERVLGLLDKKSIPPIKFLQLVRYKLDGFGEYRLHCTDDEIDKFLISRPLEDILNDDSTRILAQNFSLLQYLELLSKQLREFASQLDIRNVDRIILKLKEFQHGNGYLGGVLTDKEIGEMYEDIDRESMPFEKELLAMMVARGDEFSSLKSDLFDEDLDNDDKLLAEFVSKTILNYTSYEKLLMYSEFFKERVLYRNVINLLVAGHVSNVEVDLAKIIPCYINIKGALGISSDTLLQHLDEWIKSVNWDKINADDVPLEFLEDCYEFSGLEISKRTIAWINGSFLKLTTDQLTTVFSDRNDKYFRLFSNLPDSSLTQSSLTVFKNIFISKLKEGGIIEDYWQILGRYDRLHGVLSIDNILRDILDDVMLGSLSIQINDLVRISPFFIAHNSIDTQRDIFRKLFKAKFLDSVEFVNLVIQNRVEFERYLNEVRPEDKSDFLNTIKENSNLVEQMSFLLGD